MGTTAALTLFVALLRYAIDLLGVVFLIVLVGFSIRAISDWLTEGESGPGWALGAVLVGLMGTASVGLWLAGSSAVGGGSSLEGRLPGVVVRAIDALESNGWGQRAMLGGGERSLPLAPRPPAGDEAPPARDAGRTAGPAAPARPAPGPVEGPPSLGPRAPSARAGRDAKEPGVAEAAPAPAGATADAAPAVTTTTLSVWPSGSVVGRSVRLTAHVTSPAGVPTGPVLFYRGEVLLGSVRLGPDGEGGATCVLVTVQLPLGDHEIRAEYAGTPGYHPSASTAVAHAVRRD